MTRDPDGTILEIKEQSGKDIWLWGSLKLMHCLLHAALSRSLGAGTPGVARQGNVHFEDRQDLKLVEGIVAYPDGGLHHISLPEKLRVT